MKNSKKHINKGIIVLSKGERVAVIGLLTIIAILLGISIFVPMLPLSEADRNAFHQLDSLLAVQEAAAQRAQEHQQALQATSQTQPSDGNPNQARAAPRTTTGHNRSYSQSHYQNDSPSDSKPEHAEPSRRPSIPILDLNLADSTELVAIPQIGTVTASRIHRYRNRLGGFVELTQLYEIKGMDTARFETIQPYLRLDHHDIRKINVNRDEFKVLLRHPYLEYEQVKAIVNHRERKGLIKDWNQLQGIVGEVNPLLERYVDY